MMFDDLQSSQNILLENYIMSAFGDIVKVTGYTWNEPCNIVLKRYKNYSQCNYD